MSSSSSSSSHLFGQQPQEDEEGTYYTVALINAHFSLRRPEPYDDDGDGDADVEVAALPDALEDKELRQRTIAHGLSSVEVWYQLLLISWLRVNNFVSQVMGNYIKATGFKKNILNRKFSMSDALLFLLLDRTDIIPGARRVLEAQYQYMFFPGRSDARNFTLGDHVNPEMQRMHSCALHRVGMYSSLASMPKPYSRQDIIAMKNFFVAYFASRDAAKAAGKTAGKMAATAAVAVAVSSSSSSSSSSPTPTPTPSNPMTLAGTSHGQEEYNNNTKRRRLEPLLIHVNFT